MNAILPAIDRPQPASREGAPEDAWNVAMLTKLKDEILPRYLPERRWFGRKGDQIHSVTITHELPIGEIANVRLIVAEVTFAEGNPESYTLILALRDGLEAARLRADSPEAIIALIDGDTVLCDGLYLAEVRAELLESTAMPALSPPGLRLEGMSGRSLRPADARSFSRNSRLLGADHSNTAIVFADRWFFKLYRKFELGPHPDITLTRNLSEQHRLEFVPRFAGSLSLVEGVQSGAIGLLVEMVRHQGDCWTHTLAVLEKYFDRVWHGRRDFSEENAREMAGEDFVAQARSLGRRTGQIHLALSSTRHRSDFAPEPFTRSDQDSLRQAVWNSASESLRQLHASERRLPADLRAAATELMAKQGQLVTICDRLRNAEIAGQKIRVHGDYHLGQVLKTAGDFVVIDFEGEPRRSLIERTSKRTPLVDVAGMLRSFDYAASAALARLPEAERIPLARWGDAWVRTVSAAFLGGYLDTTRGAAFLPPKSTDGQFLLEVLLLEKAIYEIGYELNYRPDFLGIPLRAICRLIQDPSAVLGAWN